MEQGAMSLPMVSQGQRASFSQSSSGAGDRPPVAGNSTRSSCCCCSSSDPGHPPGTDWEGKPLKKNKYGLEEIWTYRHPVMRERPWLVQLIRKHSFRIFMALIFGGTIIALAVLYHQLPPQPGEEVSVLGIKCSKQWRNLFKYMSIPLVSVLFTWWHVWLGIKMCFYPVEFVPRCGYPVFGWQGIVPRRAKTMAERACKIMIGKLLVIAEIVDQIDPEDFFRELHNVLWQTTTKVVDRLAASQCPSLWSQIPVTAQEEIKMKIMEMAPTKFQPVLDDIKEKSETIIDFEKMAVEILVKEKATLVEMFQKIGEREFTFVQHFSAVLGFILGVFQMFMWVLINAGSDEEECKPSNPHSHDFHCWAGFVVLPTSGLIIGYLTNWLGINLIFRPVWPHIYCGGYVNFQGVFLKRQQEVSAKMTVMICKELVNAHRIVEYILGKEEIKAKVLDIFKGHVHGFISELTESKVIGPVLRKLLPTNFLQSIEGDVVNGILEELPNHQKEIETYMDEKFDMVTMLTHRLSHLPPSEFEGMLHPVFQEDEWMVLLLGGVLGVLVGTLQAFALGS
eukprot:TRINITY_DN58625_c0_g1_i1.p1 TRINITY_DN58625_c0_g1~~TRINITY_DN58625_c0_g1_i1.p1  ORF type:complete len:603 (+),score=95.11 TRINITY_DN58625_c0_g1_i1:120-1811(+)